MSFTFNAGIPAAANNPSNDQNTMKVNNVSNAAIWDIDHVGFNKSNGGYHTVVHLMPNNAPAATPTIGQIISNVGNDGFANDTTLFFQTGGSILAQLTRNFQPIVLANGATFLPGGLVLQWGIVNGSHAGGTFNGGDTGTVNFATANKVFPNNCFSVWAQLNYTTTAPSSNSGQGNVTIDTATILPTGFTWTVITNSGAYKQFFWVALGN